MQVFHTGFVSAYSLSRAISSTYFPPDYVWVQVTSGLPLTTGRPVTFCILIVVRSFNFYKQIGNYNKYIKIFPILFCHNIRP